jgi:fermentation-respiration switch protein FrsA (DUF1100 family)
LLDATLRRLNVRLVYVSVITLIVGIAALIGFVRWLEPRFAFFPSAGEAETPRHFGVEYEPLTIDTSDGEHLHAWLMRAASPRAAIVYFHGNGGNLSIWAPILAGLVRHGFSVLAVDYRGYGLSTGRPSERGLYHDVDATLARASNSFDAKVPVVYWGRSLGATMAAYAATRRAPRGLILESGFPDARSVIRSSPPLLLLSLFSSYRFATARHLQSVRVPILVMHGDRDSVIPYTLGRTLFDGIQGSKTFVTIAGGDHNDLAPTDPQAYWAAVERFVQGLPAAPADR